METLSFSRVFSTLGSLFFNRDIRITPINMKITNESFFFQIIPLKCTCEDISIYYFVYHSDQGGVISLLKKYEKEGHHSVL